MPLTLVQGMQPDMLLVQSLAHILIPYSYAFSNLRVARATEMSGSFFVFLLDVWRHR